mmetsp:Transcript_12920/g.15111  ORF Transcript_12920/g.15111 Transcript_12920/m.15111 type:complete len:84 (+) Transcript_12920:188-439(+)
MLGFLLSPIEFVLITIYAPLVSLKALESETYEASQWNATLSFTFIRCAFHHRHYLACLAFFFSAFSALEEASTCFAWIAPWIC